MDPKELTDEELAEVTKAMEEFAAGSWTPSPKKAPKKPRRAPLPVKPILIISAVLFALVALMVLIAILPKADPSTPTEPSTEISGPTATRATQNSTGSTELITPPVLPSSDATEAPTQATEAPTQTTEEPTQATEAPTQPPVEVPEGTLLSGEERNALQTLFQWPSYYAIASNHTFSKPSELSLFDLLCEAPDMEQRFDMTEAEEAYLSTISESFIVLDTTRISKDVAARVLAQYYGLSLEDFRGTNSAVYWEETDCFYFAQSDSVACDLTITHALTLENGNIWVRYEDKHSGRTGEMLLRPTDNGYQILSNQTTR